MKRRTFLQAITAGFAALGFGRTVKAAPYEPGHPDLGLHIGAAWERQVQGTVQINARDLEMLEDVFPADQRWMTRDGGHRFGKSPYGPTFRVYGDR